MTLSCLKPVNISSFSSLQRAATTISPNGQIALSTAKVGVSMSELQIKRQKATYYDVVSFCFIVLLFFSSEMKHF
jgi:hypothetical protein